MTLFMLKFFSRFLLSSLNRLETPNSREFSAGHCYVQILYNALWVPTGAQYILIKEGPQGQYAMLLALFDLENQRARA
jgi:hypothetical protein